MRVGIGYDVHKLVENRALILGGVEIPWEKGLLGHSDADVLLHAIMDALLGAAALGDIGKHFPDTDPKYKGISSIKLLEHVGALLEENGYAVENIDAVVIAQRPKLCRIFRRWRRILQRHWALRKISQCKSNDRRRAWIYRKRRRDFFPGCLHALIYKRVERDGGLIRRRV